MSRICEKGLLPLAVATRYQLIAPCLFLPLEFQSRGLGPRVEGWVGPHAIARLTCQAVSVAPALWHSTVGLGYRSCEHLCPDCFFFGSVVLADGTLRS